MNRRVGRFIRDAFTCHRTFSTSQLEHFLSLPNGQEKYQRIIDLLDTQTIHNISMPNSAMATELFDSVIRSGSLRHIQELNSKFNSGIPLSPHHINLVLDSCVRERDVEFAFSFLDQIRTSVSIEKTHLNKLLSCALEHLTSQCDVPFQPVSNALPFPSDYARSFGLIQRVLDEFKQCSVDLDSDSLKMIVGHFIQLGNFECAKDLLIGLAKEGFLSQDDALHTDLIVYFMHKAVECSDDYFDGNARICLELMQHTENMPKQATQILFTALVDNFRLPELKTLINLEGFDDGTLLLINPFKLLDCTLKYRELSTCAEFLMRLSKVGVVPTAEHFANIFDSIVEFDPYSDRSPECKFDDLKEFLKHVKKMAPQLAGSDEFRQGITSTCLKSLPPQSFVSFLETSM